MTKSLIILVFLTLAGILKSEEITVFDNSYLSLKLVVKDQASLATSDWLAFLLTNKSDQPLRIDQLDYAINGFEETAEGERKFVKAKYGSGNKYELIHWFHDYKDLTHAAKMFSIPAGENIRFWKHPSDKTSLAIEASLIRSEEFCALMELNLAFSSGKISKELVSENPFCTQWIKYSQIKKSNLVERFQDCITDVHEQSVHSSMIAILPQLKDLHILLDDDIIAQGIVKRSNEIFDRERIWLLLVLQEKEKIANTTLLNHYRECMQDKGCRWEDDFQVYWDNRILNSFLDSPLYVDKKAAILEIHSKYWSSSQEIKDSIFEYMMKSYQFKLNETVTEKNFKNWYNKIKYIASSRHENLIPYFEAMLDDERFFPIEDWSAVGSGKVIRSEDRNKSRTVYFRVCDVAYVCLLKVMEQIQIENTYKQNRVRPSVYIDNKWRGQNESVEKSVRLKNPYTVLQANLKLAEKYYYLYEDNKAAIVKLIKNRLNE